MDGVVFENRNDAGKQLAEKLLSYKLQSPVLVALPRGGVAVAKPIADQLGVKIDIIVAKKIGAPGNPELAIGAVTSYGDYVISPYLNHELGEKKWNYIQNQIVYLVNDCCEREKKYCCKGVLLERPSYNGKIVVLVDDGTATGMTALAAIKSIKKQNPAFLVLAIPVISKDAYSEIEKQVDKIETLKIPEDFIAVGIHYKNFEPVTDDEIKSLLG